MRGVELLVVVLAAAAPVHADSELTTRLDRLAKIFDDVHFELVPSGMTEHFVRWHRAMRDVAYHTAEGLAVLAERAELRIPDVSVLTTEPVEKTESSGFGWRDDP